MALIIVLGFLEGLEVSVLSIQLASPEVWSAVYHDKYNRARDIHKMTSGMNARSILSFVLGRQVLVTLVVFALSLFTSFKVLAVGEAEVPAPEGADWMRFFPWVPEATIPSGVKIFFEQGLTSVIFIACAGQLAPQIVAAAFPVQFCNLPFAWTLVKLCIIIDEIGLTYFSWAEERFVAWALRMNSEVNAKLQEHAEHIDVIPASGRATDAFTLEGKTSPIKKAVNIFRYSWSIALVLVSCVFVLPAIVTGDSAFSSTFPDVPGWVALIIFLILLGFLWILEGTQVALVNLARHSDEPYKEKYPRAASVRKMVASEKQIGAYLIGRQLCTVTTVFFAANLTHISMTTYPGTDAALSPTFVSIFLSSGLMGNIIVTLAGQLTPRLLCTDYPVQTLNVPGFPIVIYICRAVAFLGIGHFSWILYYLYTFNLDTTITDKMGLKKRDAREGSDEELAEMQNANISRADWTAMNERVELLQTQLQKVLERLDETPVIPDSPVARAPKQV